MLISLRTKLILAGVAVLLVIASYLTWAHAIRESALRDLKISQLSQKVDSLRADSGRLEIKYLHDTLVLRKSFARTDTLRDTLLATFTDTVYKDRIVREFVAAESAEKKACSIVVATCEQRAVNAEKRAAASDSLYQQERQKTPSLWKRSGSMMLHWGEAAIACHFLKC